MQITKTDFCELGCNDRSARRIEWEGEQLNVCKSCFMEMMGRKKFSERRYDWSMSGIWEWLYGTRYDKEELVVLSIVAALPVFSVIAWLLVIILSSIDPFG